jgi:formylglycine-generating enzyme required for sulfatase activity
MGLSPAGPGPQRAPRYSAPVAAVAFACAALLATPESLGASPSSIQPFKDCPDCPEMLMVPAGRFLMGTAPEYQIATEVPAELSPVEIRIDRPFALGRFEVTRGEYAAFAKATGRDTTPVRCRTWVEERKGFRDLDITWDAALVPSQPTDRHPAVCIDWYDAAAYAKWLSERTGQRYRLPSEAEWEYAARAGTRTLRPWGNDPDRGCRDANVNDRRTAARYPLGWSGVDCDDGFADVAPVGSLRPNAFGLHDMLGNVWEWAEDCSTLDYVGRPVDARPWVWEGGCRRRIQRGGGWSTGPERSRPGFHGDGGPDDRSDFAGFRVARDVGSDPAPRERAQPDEGVVAAAAPAASVPARGALRSLRDCANCPEIIELPAGEFSFGSSADDYEHDQRSGESPALRVKLRRGFALGARELSVAEFRQFLVATGYRPRLDCAADARAAADEPARCITPPDADAYLAWLSSETGKRYRLPSETEWEYAIRAGTATARFWSGRDSHEGISISRACDYGNVRDVTARDLKVPGPWARCSDGYPGVAPVGRFMANPWGFHDLTGNVRELLADCFTTSYKGRPADERPWRWSGCGLRAVRGGSWKSRPFDLRSPSRDRIALDATDVEWQDVGLRVARD